MLPEFNPLVSFYSDAFENLPTDIPAANFIASIKSGTYAGKIKTIRSRFQTAIARGVPYDDAKKAVDSLKKKLGSVTLAGIQAMRANKFTPQFTGLIQADFDLLGDKLKSIRDLLADDPHVFCVFISATGEGLKAWYRIPICKNADEYKFAFDTLAKHVLQFTGCKIDELKEVARLCYASHDKDCFHNPNAIELPVDFAQMPLPAAKPIPSKSPALNGESRRAAAEKLVGKIEHTDTGDFCKCPGEHLHTNGKAPKDCRVTLDGVPTIFCLHKSCSQVIEAANHELRSQIGKAEFVPTRTRQAAPLADSNRAEIAAEYLGEEIEQPADTLPDFIDAANFLATPIEPPAELIEGILHKGSKLAFGGSSKSFKTWCLLDLAISVATGADWLGRRTTQGKVLFLNFEIQPHAWQRRIAAVASAKGVEIKPGQIILWNLRGHAADFRQIVPRIIERARRENFVLNVLDPIYKLYGNTDENSAGNGALLWNSLEKLATETGAANAFGAHFAKGNASAKEAIDRISGSGVFARDPDSLLIFTKHETDDAFTVEPILRNFAPVEPFAVRWEFPLMKLADDLDPSKLKQVAGRKKEHNPKKLLTAIAQTTRENPISVSAWATAGNVPRQTLTDYLPEMRHKKWIETTGEGNAARQFITNEGKAFINEN